MQNNEFIETEKRLEAYTQKSIWIENYTLDRFLGFMKYLGSPHDSLRFVHIAGTSGKGSTTAYTQQILSSHGLKTGSFFSPHIFSVRERICIDGEPVSEEEFTAVFDEVAAAHDNYFTDKTGVTLIYFEFVLAMAFVLFARRHLDAVVLEVGMGGKLDPTNIIDAEVAVLTSVGLDHQEFLGNTVEEIAADKVQILKPSRTMVTGVTSSSVLRVIEDHAVRMNATLLRTGRDFTASDITVNRAGTVFTYTKDRQVQVTLRQHGRHQAENAAVALTAAAEFLGDRFNPDHAALALQDTRLNGRIQIFSEDPLVITDVAHNADKMAALVRTLDEIDPDVKIRLVTGFKKGRDKVRARDAVRQLSTIKDRLQAVYLCDFAATQDLYVSSVPAAELDLIFDEILPGVTRTSYTDVNQAVLQAVAQLQDDEMLLITGSFYLLGLLDTASLRSALEAM
ncbi:MAG: Folylpolyglutamate synthase [candidate division WS6 bacterium OLB20]|uniref:tetrahydrofolate synthase n=1 Tax=candidate division WS6 bacterium OLB20 TaxID=1617426 RepID=A0A136LXX0_9BACT|nr:MAG: Folylpolyglutamate synthase [candidate division WS6 bacterium OLB20]